MINISLSGNVIQVSCSGKIYKFTDQNGQIEIDNIVAFFHETDRGLLNGKIEYDFKDNTQLESGLKLFISELFTKLHEEKTNIEENIEEKNQSEVENELSFTANM